MSIEPIDTETVLVRTPQGNILITHKEEHKTEIRIYSSRHKEYIAMAEEPNHPTIIKLV